MKLLSIALCFLSCVFMQDPNPEPNPDPNPGNLACIVELDVVAGRVGNTPEVYLVSLGSYVIPDGSATLKLYWRDGDFGDWNPCSPNATVTTLDDYCSNNFNTVILSDMVLLKAELIDNGRIVDSWYNWVIVNTY